MIANLITHGDRFLNIIYLITLFLVNAMTYLEMTQPLVKLQKSRLLRVAFINIHFLRRFAVYYTLRSNLLYIYFHFSHEQVIVAIILGIKFGDAQELSKSFSILVVVVICLFVVAFGWSWGPLGWTIPSEIFPLEIRSAGQSITVAVNLLFTFIVAQAFLALLCSFKFGIFLFFAGWITLMTIFVFLFLPETKGIPIEEMSFMWRKHWFWTLILPQNEL